MRRRLYVMLPDVETTRQVVNELLLARIDDKHIHVLAKEGTPLEDLPEAGLREKSDLVHGLEVGLSVGGATGILAGLIAMTFPPAGVVLGGGAVLATALAGAGVGSWISGMVGSGVPNTRLKEFEDGVEKGQILLMTDVAKEREPEIEEMIRKHHPEADVGGTEPTIPAFP
ncbi:MAG: DUF1269 domain-containing protein [Pseudomonadota bacterium]